VQYTLFGLAGGAAWRLGVDIEMRLFLFFAALGVFWTIVFFVAAQQRRRKQGARNGL
jgi:hypothetical protein